MRTYVKALRSGRTDNPKPYLLIIEEINRARVASVFGDVFQLLDRTEDGTSQYEIQASEDIRKYLALELGGHLSDYPILKIPNNMFLWASMNSADQGVYPMDTAFKRRWDFEYISIDANQEKVECTVNLVKDNPETNVNWNRLRKAINAKLLDTCRVNEDKLLGPFFLSKKAIKADEANHIIDEEAFRKAFKSKVIMYLLRMLHVSIGADCSNRISVKCTLLFAMNLISMAWRFSVMILRVLIMISRKTDSYGNYISIPAGAATIQ